MPNDIDLSDNNLKIKGLPKKKQNLYESSVKDTSRPKVLNESILSSSIVIIEYI